MASIYVLEIDGWGEVGPAIAITDAEGFADGTFTLTTAGSPPPTTEYGAMVWVQDVSAVVADGYYTLTARTATTFTMQALPAQVTVTTAAGLSGLARIEDHYKISDGIPAWVTGSLAQARWYQDLSAVSHSAGQRMGRLGGVSSVDQWSFLTTSPGRGLLATAPLSYRNASAGAVTLAADIAASETTISAFSAAPYSGESASSPTGPARPIVIGTEAIDVRGTASSTAADGATTYTVTHDGSSDFVTRGVLRTEKFGHLKGEFLYGALPTPIGQIVRSYDYPEGHSSHASRSAVAVGVGEAVTAIGKGNDVQVDVASSVIDPNRKELGGSYGLAIPGIAISEGIERGDDLTFELEVTQRSDSQWSWIRDGNAAIKITWADELISTESDGARVYKYTVTTWPLTNSEDYPIVRPAESGARFAAVATDRGRRLWLTNSGWGRGGRELCHVFEPVTWTFPTSSPGAGPGVVHVNPVDVLLTVLMSTGTPAANGAHDLAPAEFGMGIPAAQIDMDSFTAIGDQLHANFIAAATVFIDHETTGTLKNWMTSLCRMFGLAVVTTSAGLIRLIDVADVSYTGAAAFTESDMVGPVSINYAVSPGTSVSQVKLKFPTPFIRPINELASGDEPDVYSAPGSAFEDGILVEGKIQDHTDEFNQSGGGVTSLLRRIGGSSETVKTEFAPYQNYSQRDALRQRFVKIMTQNAGVGAVFSVDVLPSFSADIGDVFEVTLANLPDPQNSAGMSGTYCRVMDRIHEYRPVGEGVRDTLMLRVFGTSEAAPPQWSPSGEVSSVVSNKVFDVVAAEFHGPDDTSDATTFPDGAKVHIFGENFQLRSTTSAGTVGSTSGNTITLSVAASGGGGPVTPNVGDLVLLAPVSEQSASIAAPFAEISQDTPGDVWS